MARTTHAAVHPYAHLTYFRSDLFDVEVICGVAMGRKQCSGRPGRPKKRIFHGRKPHEPEPEKCPHPAPELAADNPIENVFPDLFENSSDSLNSESDHHSTDDSESAEESSESEPGSDTDSQDDEAATTGYRLIDLECLQSLLQKGVSCNACHSNVTLKETKREGLASTLSVVCDRCDVEETETMSKKFNRVSEVNRRFVLGMRLIGKGHQAMVKFSAALNMPRPMSLSSYHGHTKSLVLSADTVAERSMDIAAAEIRIPPDVTCETAVTYDGSDAILKVVKPVYLPLADRSLLERCLRGATQNRNECFNGLVWQMCPKTGFCSARIVEMAIALAAAWFNDGPASISALLTEMGLPVGSCTASALGQLQLDRQKHAARKRSAEVKRRRKRRRRVRKGIQEEEVAQEGVSYEAGGF